MRIWRTTLTAGVLVTLAAVAVPCQAQQVTLATPYRTASSSFFENSNISWAGNYRGVNFSVGSAALATPPFGSPQSTAGLSTNFAILGKYGQVYGGLNFGQGCNQALTTQTPSVTIMNGQTGYVSDTSQTPFVISVVPVVGGFPVAPQPFQQISVDPSAFDPRVEAIMRAHADAQPQAGGQAPPQQNPGNKAPQQKKAASVPAPPDPGEVAQQRLSAAQESTAGRPALSVAEAKRLHQQEQTAANGELAALMERARALEEDGKPSVAKIYYQRIAKHATGELQQQARTRLYEIDAGKR